MRRGQGSANSRLCGRPDDSKTMKLANDSCVAADVRQRTCTVQSLVNLQVVTAIRESMTDAEDLDGLRILYRFGCSFALHSLSPQVMVHERSFGEWTLDGETHHKRMLGLTHDGLECVDAVCARMTIDMWRVDEWAFADAVKRDI